MQESVAQIRSFAKSLAVIYAHEYLIMPCSVINQEATKEQQVASNDKSLLK